MLTFLYPQSEYLDCFFLLEESDAGCCGFGEDEEDRDEWKRFKQRKGFLVNKRTLLATTIRLDDIRCRTIRLEFRWIQFLSVW